MGWRQYTKAHESTYRKHHATVTSLEFLVIILYCIWAQQTVMKNIRPGSNELCIAPRNCFSLWKIKNLYSICGYCNFFCHLLQAGSLLIDVKNDYGWDSQGGHYMLFIIYWMLVIRKTAKNGITCSKITNER